MGSLPKNLALVRVDKEIYNDFKKYCEEEGFVVPKKIGFILRDYLKNKNFKVLDTQKNWTPETQSGEEVSND